MTKKLQISCLVLSCLIMFATLSVIGQNVNMNHWIELNVTPGDSISIDFWSGPNTGIKIVSGTYERTISADSSWYGTTNHYAQSSTMRIYGNLYAFYCSDNSLRIKGIDVSNNSELISLICYNNDISSIKVSGIPNLNYISCYNNNLSACGLDSIFHQLPQNLGSGIAAVEIKSGSLTNPGTSSCCDTIATNKNWRVIDYILYDDSISYTDIVNTNYACPYFTLVIEDIKREEIVAKVYPNPVSNALNIETMENVENVILYDVLGKEVMCTKKTNDIDVSNLNNGIYILKLITEKGIGEYKIVKE
ncbi:MAG: Protein of unknown function precursor containing leucine-rich repeat and a C-terminal secretion [Bacteroidetes bacterium]|nr:Protein of unknown function precursor containing leucine-rich repeat and a C-terminal secretion [Bacteroidota bacterium]